MSERKTITIQKTEFTHWIGLKAEGESWTSLMRRIRGAYEILSTTTPRSDVEIRRIRRMPSSTLNTDRGQRPSIKREFLSEMKNLFDGEKGWVDVLKPMSDEDLSNLQLSEEELFKRDQERRFKQLKPPK